LARAPSPGSPWRARHPLPRCGRGALTRYRRESLAALGGAVADAALMLGAMSAAKDVAGRLDSMPADLAAAMRARGRHRLHRAVEAVEGHRAAGAGDLEGLVVIVAADIASGHRGSPEMPLTGKRRV